MGGLISVFRGRIYSVMNDDHARLFQLLKDVKRLADGSVDGSMDRGMRKRACGEGLRRLIDDTATHFAREEALMKAFGYPDLVKHRNSHIILIRTIQTYHSKFIQEDKSLTSADFEYLDAWLTNHIRHDDRDIEDYLAAHPLVEESASVSETANVSLRPQSVRLGLRKIMLWIKLCLFRTPIDARRKNRERSQRSAASRLRHINSQNRQAALQKKNQGTDSYHGWYYGNR